MDDLLIKYILEEVTPEENDQVQQWLAANATNRTHFEKLQAAWQLAAQPNQQLASDTPQALQRLKQTLHTRETATIKRIWPRVWRAAAAAVGIAGVALGAYVWMKPTTPVKELPPVVQPDTVQQKSVRLDTMPIVQPVPALPADTLPFVKPHKKTRPLRTTHVQRVHPKKKQPEPVMPVERVQPKKKTVQQPTQPTDPRPVKKKHRVTTKRVQPVKKHKSATAPTAPQAPAKEPPIS
jgi:hypothetical protein